MCIEIKDTTHLTVSNGISRTPLFKVCVSSEQLESSDLSLRKYSFSQSH